jgi:asparagine synthase (glutamine-hydrolysing)
VLRGYLEWGDAVAERLNGMYAFAIWDGRATGWS